MRFLSFCLLILLLTGLWLGCGGNDSPSAPDTPAAPRLVAYHATTAPPMNSTEAAVWSSATTTAVPSSAAITPAPPMSSVMALPDSIKIQAITYHDTLYLRIKWRDATHSVSRGAYAVVDTGVDCGEGHKCVIFSGPDTIAYAEDQLWVLFAGLSSGDFDGINWRALTTDSTFLAEGINLHRTNDTMVLIRDAGTAEVARRNYNISNPTQPCYFHKTGSANTGYTLFDRDGLIPFDFTTTGWTMGQLVPGWLLDSTFQDSSATVLNSRWDTHSISTWKSESGTYMYTVVLRRPLNTGYADDVTLADSVQVRLGVFDNQMDINIGGTGRGFTNQFWMVL